MKVHTAQLAGGTANADRVFTTDRAVIVLDGATAFEPVAVDPGTYADTLGKFIAEQFDTAPNVDIGAAVADAIRHAAAVLHLDAGASPSSTVAILRTRDDTADLYVLGDSPIFYGAGNRCHRLADERLADLPLTERGRYKAALRAGAGYGEEHRVTLAALQRAQRRYRNTPDGYWIAEADPAAAQHGHAVTLPSRHIAWAVLATDGAADPLTHHGRPEWSEIAHYDNAALAGLLAHLHQWENEHDPHGQFLPRAKRHDDKTVAAVPSVSRPRTHRTALPNLSL